jgi:hypothetical protein
MTIWILTLVMMMGSDYKAVYITTFSEEESCRSAADFSNEGTPSDEIQTGNGVVLVYACDKEESK